MRKFTGTWGRLAAGVILLAVLAGTAGCSSDSGSKEFIPGKGWKSTQTTPRAPGS